MCTCNDCKGITLFKGKDGVGIIQTVDNGNGTFTFTYSDGTTFTTSDLRGAQGIQGIQGIQGPIGPEGPQGIPGPVGPTSVGPTGIVLPWAGIAPLPPTGWLFCDGATLLAAAYPDLFTAIGTIYDPGVPSGYFSLPNLENKIPVGKGTNTGGYNLDTIGATGGSETVALTKTQLPKHKHVIGTGLDGSSLSDPGNHNHRGGYTFNAILEGGNVPYEATWDIDEGGSVGPTFKRVGGFPYDDGAHTHTGDTGNGTTDGLNGDAHGNMQPYIIMRYIIKI